MKSFQEVVDMGINNKILSDKIYDSEPVKDMTDRSAQITAAN